MGEEALTVAALAQFHRDVVMPEFRREMDALRIDIRAEFAGHLDAMYKRFDRLETEYHALAAAVRRLEERMGAVEQRLDGIEKRLDKMALKSELDELKSRVHGLQAQIKDIEDRLSA